MDSQTENITCTECKRKVLQPKGFLTLEQIEKYKCENCSQPVLENRVAAGRLSGDNRKLLTED